MRGEDKYYQSESDLSPEEFTAMKDLIELCRQVVKMADNKEIVLIHSCEETVLRGD